MPERTCVVTRAVRPPSQMIRFVLGPDGAVVPDLRRRLPGRGVWTTATRAAVAEAVRRKLFARGLKTAARADVSLPDVVDALLRDAALQGLSMARKAGALVAGSAKVDGAVRANETVALIHASDAAPDGTRKLDQAVTAVGHMGGEPVDTFAPFTVDELSAALGGHNVVHAALLHGEGSRGPLERLRTLRRYRGEEGPPDP